MLYQVTRDWEQTQLLICCGNLSRLFRQCTERQHIVVRSFISVGGPLVVGACYLLGRNTCFFPTAIPSLQGSDVSR